MKPRTENRYNLLFVTLVLTFLGSATADLPDSPKSMLDMLPTILDLTSNPPPESNLTMMCQVRTDSGETPEQSFASILSIDGETALLVAFSAHKLERPWETMTFRPVLVFSGQSHPTNQGTADWAFVFDRNGDGFIDFSSYLVGPMTMPSGIGMLFWHMSDDNFDGDHDGVVVGTYDRESRKLDGWAVLADTDFDGKYESCTWRQKFQNGTSGPCSKTDDGFEVAGKAFIGLRSLPPSKDFLMADLHRAVAACELGAENLYQDPSLVHSAAASFHVLNDDANLSQQVEKRGGTFYAAGTDAPITGVVTSQYPGGQRHVEIELREGKKEGLETHWYPDGQLEAEQNFRNGRKDGRERQWYKNGQIKVDAFFVGGKEEGPLTMWFADGQAEMELNYEDGRQIGLERQWYENGQLKVEINYKNQNPTGVVTWWYSNGQKYQESTYKNGRLHGRRTQWHANGEKMSEGKFKNGEPIGRHKRWDETGREMN
jgi:antitoxin component YwqK of YwqJK toxin-antitoxin module